MLDFVYKNGDILQLHIAQREQVDTFHQVFVCEIPVTENGPKPVFTRLVLFCPMLYKSVRQGYNTVTVQVKVVGPKVHVCVQSQ